MTPGSSLRRRIPREMRAALRQRLIYSECPKASSQARGPLIAPPCCDVPRVTTYRVFDVYMSL